MNDHITLEEIIEFVEFEGQDSYGKYLRGLDASRVEMLKLYMQLSNLESESYKRAVEAEAAAKQLLAETLKKVVGLQKHIHDMELNKAVTDIRRQAEADKVATVYAIVCSLVFLSAVSAHWWISRGLPATTVWWTLTGVDLLALLAVYLFIKKADKKN